MRFALMIEPQQGHVATPTSWRSRGAPRPTASRRSSGPTTTRASRAKPASRRPTPGPSSPASPARPSGSRSACSSLRSRSAIPGNFAKIVTHGRRDERRPDRGRRRCRLERRRSTRSWASPSRRSRSGPTCSRTSWRSSTGCGRARRLVVRRASPGSGSTARCFRPRPVEVAGRPRRPPAGSGPGSSPAARATPRSYRLAARYADEFNLARRRRSASREVGAKLDEACRAIGRDPATLARSAMAGVLDRSGPGRGRSARARAARRLRRRTRKPAEAGSTSGAPAGSSGRRTRRGRRSSASRRPGSSGSCSRTSCPGTSTTST